MNLKKIGLKLKKLGKYISALSNAALINRSEYAFFFWGVNDITHEVVETTFDWNIEINH